MEKTNVNLEKVLELFARRGIEKRKQATVMAGILGIQYKSAKQKLDGQRGVKFGEVQKIYDYFREKLSKRTSHNGLFIANDMHIRCNIEVDDEEVLRQEPGVNYAFKDRGLWVVNHTSNQIHKDLKKVIKMEVLPPPKIAILDNDPEILELMESVSNRYGIDSTLFKTKAELLEQMKKNTFDAYVIDWLLDYEINTAEVVKTVRAGSDEVPVILLTGQLDQHENEIACAIAQYGIELIEKPTRVNIIASVLIAHLFH